MATLERLLAGDDAAAAIRVTPEGPVFTRGALRADVKAVSVALARAGVLRGDVVSLCFRNQIESVISFLAVTWLGATAAPLNASYAAAEFEYDMLNISSKFLVVPTEGHALAEEVAAKVGVATLGVATSASGTSVAARARCVVADGGVTIPEAQPEDTALFLHTSGTTGKPKGVPLSHANMLATTANITATYDLTAADKCYLVMPLFHVHGLMSALFSTLYSGGEVILPANCAGFRVEIFWRDIAACGATWYTAVPTMQQLLLKGLDSYAAAGRPQVRFIRSCSASLPPSVLQSLEKEFGAPVLEAYAMTEAAHQISSNPLPSRGPHKAGSVGKGTNVEIAILPEEGEAALPNGEVGEVSVRGRNVTKGYHNRPDANAESFTPSGFFRTGDLGYLDEEGYLFLTGRKKEQVNRGGEKIAPVAIDNVLLRCPGVSSLFAFGSPHEELGESVVAIAVLDPGAEVSLAQLNRFGLDTGELSMQWLPEAIVYADKVPKGPTGKVQRVKLAAMLGMPKLSAADAGAAFSFVDGVLTRLAPPATTDAGDGNAADMCAVEAAVGSLLGVDVSGLGAKPLQLDSFTAARLAGSLNKRFGCGVPPKALLRGVTMAAILNLVQTTEAVAAAAYDWEAEAAVPPELAAGMGGVPFGPAVPLGEADALLLTGATGFLGTHLLASLLAADKGPAVVCVVRAASDAAAAGRVSAALRARGVWSDAARSPKLRCLAGDVTLPGFGLSDGVVAASLGSVRLVIHNAAAVNHATAYAGLKEANVGSLVRAIRLAHGLEAANRKPVHVAFVSTAGVCGRRACHDAPAPPRIEMAAVDGANGYVQGKWVAERLIENANAAARSAGAPARYSIFRPGAISGHSVTGDCNIGDSLNRYLVGFRLLGLAPPLPDMRVRVDMSPVDWVAGAIGGIATQEAGGAAPRERCETPCFTLDNGASLPYDDLLTELDVPVAPSYEAWLAELQADMGRYGEIWGDIGWPSGRPRSARESARDCPRGPEIAREGPGLSVLQAALEAEPEAAPHPNPLRGLLGALKAAPPSFGSTGSKAHMAHLAERGHPCPTVTPALLRTYLRRFEEEGALPRAA